MRNKISDLSDHLFAQIERLNDESIEGEALKIEIARGKAMAALATPIVNSAKLTIDAAKLANRGEVRKKDMMLIYDKNDPD
jgi:hypothetical protein